MERKKCSPFSPSNLTPRLSSSDLRTASSAGSSADLGQEAGLARVGGQEPGQVLRAGQRGAGEQHPLEELQEAARPAPARRGGGGRRGPRTRPRWAPGCSARGRRRGRARRCPAAGTRAGWSPAPGGRLRGSRAPGPSGRWRRCRRPGGLTSMAPRAGFWPPSAPRSESLAGRRGRCLGGARAPHLVGGEQPAVGQAGAPVLEVHEAADLGLEPAADLLKESVQRRVVRKLRHSLPGYLRVPHAA